MSIPTKSSGSGNYKKSQKNTFPMSLLQKREDSTFELILGKGTVVPEDIITLAEMLKTDQTISRVSISDIYVGDEGAKALAKALKHNHTLTTLELNGNEIGFYGTYALAHMLRANKTLTTLRLIRNNIGIAETVLLAEALETNQTLTHLDLYGNHAIGDIGREAREALSQSIRNHPNILYVGLDTRVYRIIKLCAANKSIALGFIEQLQTAPDSLTIKDTEEIKRRLPSIIEVAKADLHMDEAKITKLLINIQVSSETAYYIPMLGLANFIENGGQFNPETEIKDKISIDTEAKNAILEELRIQADGLSDPVPHTLQAKRLTHAGDVLLQEVERGLQGKKEVRRYKKQEEKKSLVGQDLSGQDLSRQDFSGWILQDTNLQDANLRKTVFRSTELQRANLQGAILINTDLRFAKLLGADLRGAFLWGANLQDADLYGANLTVADLRKADLRGARNLTIEQFATAIIDETTKLPTGIFLKAIEEMREAQLQASIEDGILPLSWGNFPSPPFL